jgi:LPXTG-motif cell wall-anchored protein
MWLRSTTVVKPGTLVKLGTVVADADGAITASVAIPATTPAGVHHLVLVDDEARGYASEDITVTAASASVAPPVALAGTAATGARLAATGQDPVPAGLLAGLLLLAGIGALTLRRMTPAAAVARATASRRS